MWNLGKNGTDGPICKLEIRDTDLKIKKQLMNAKGGWGGEMNSEIGIICKLLCIK